MSFKTNLLFFGTFLSFSLSPEALIAMDEPIPEASERALTMNEAIFKILEDFTRGFSQDEKEKLDELMQVARYSSTPLMTNEDFKSFLFNCFTKKNHSLECRKYYLTHLHLYFSYNRDDYYIDVEKTFLEKALNLHNYLIETWVKRIYPCSMLLLAEYACYKQILNAQERGEDYGYLIRNMIVYPPIMWILMDFSDRPMQLLAFLALMNTTQT